MIKTLALIPARAGSKGVPQKNIRPLAGYPLIAYSIVAARLCQQIERVIVSTDSSEIAEIATSFGAEAPFLRPAELAKDTSLDIEFVLHALDWLKNYEKTIPEYLVHLRPTTPFREPKIIDEGIELLINHPEATSLRSGHKAAESPFKWFFRNEAGYFHSISTEYSMEDMNRPRQAFPDVFIPNGYVDVLKSSCIQETKSMHGKKILGFISPRCHEVDTLEDLDYLEFEISKKGNGLLDYLKKYYPIEVERV